MGAHGGNAMPDEITEVELEALKLALEQKPLASFTEKDVQSLRGVIRKQSIEITRIKTWNAKLEAEVVKLRSRIASLQNPFAIVAAEANTKRQRKSRRNEKTFFDQIIQAKQLEHQHDNEPDRPDLTDQSRPE